MVFNSLWLSRYNLQKLGQAFTMSGTGNCGYQINSSYKLQKFVGHVHFDVVKVHLFWLTKANGKGIDLNLFALK